MNQQWLLIHNIVNLHFFCDHSKLLLGSTNWWRFFGTLQSRARWRREETRRRLWCKKKYWRKIPQINFLIRHSLSPTAGITTCSKIWRNSRNRHMQQDLAQQQESPHAARSGATAGITTCSKIWRNSICTSIYTPVVYHEGWTLSQNLSELLSANKTSHPQISTKHQSTESYLRLPWMPEVF